jgi:hypothetical protein
MMLQPKPSKRPLKPSPVTKRGLLRLTFDNGSGFGRGRFVKGPSMRFQSVFFVAFFMAIPATCLIYAWRKWNQMRNAPAQQSWREKLPTVGLCLATLCLLLTSGFLFQGFHWGVQSFASPPPGFWLTLNWVSLLSWVLACLTIVLGKGKLRFPLFVWCLGMPLLAWFVITMGYMY